MFHILGDESTLLKVDRTGLLCSLQELQSVNPGMKVGFDFGYWGARHDNLVSGGAAPAVA